MEDTQVYLYKDLFTALAKFQGEIKSIPKNAYNPYFKSKYADLATLWDTIREPLTKNGLAVTQFLSRGEWGLSLRTFLAHVSGQYIVDECPVIYLKDDPQSVGSAITYYRRYCLSAVLGLANEDEDDDAETAMDRKEEDKLKQNQHWCSVHKQPFFKKGKMTSYAHPIKDKDGNDTGEWCHESKTSPGNPSQSQNNPENGNGKGEALSETKPADKAEPALDIEWLKEQLNHLKGKGLTGWSNAAVLRKLNQLTGKQYSTPMEAIRNLTPGEAEVFTDEVREAVEMA
jgi:hypothetical protein